MHLFRHRSSTSSPHPPDRIPYGFSHLPPNSLSPANGAEQSPRSSSESLAWSQSASDPDAPKTPSDVRMSEEMDTVKDLPASNIDLTNNNKKRPRSASTQLIAQTPEDIKRIIGDGETGTKLIERYCCGGGCCFLETVSPDSGASDFVPIAIPDNEAFRSLQLKLDPFGLDTQLTNVAPLPPTSVSFDRVPAKTQHDTKVDRHPPEFVQPHPPYNVFAAPVYHARELTKPGAVKRTFHFDLDITDYPEEGGVDFKVGGAIGICPPNAPEIVDDIFDVLGVPKNVRDRVAVLKTTGGRWPTIWGEEKPRELVTTRRELLTWCSDVQSSPPTKPLLRLMAEHAEAKNEKKILEYLSSAQGQIAFCDLRTGPHITLPQLLHAFPSSKPPLPALLSVLPQLMPRFYSLSNDPHVSSDRRDLPAGRRIIEMAVSIHEMPDWRASPADPTASIRNGVGSGYLLRIANAFAASGSPSTPTSPTPTITNAGEPTSNPPASPKAAEESAKPLQIPMFRGLMANPLSREFVSDGPMLLIGAGVGMAPFRGFILNRLRHATCANKIWLIQGVRDSEFDEIYHGELGEQEGEIKRVVQSRKEETTEKAARGSKKRKFVEAQVEANSVADELDGLVQDESEDEQGVAGVSLGPKIHASAARYVQDEVRAQADVVWYVVNSVDGRVFVVGGKGMGDGVEHALVDVAMSKGGLNEHEAKEFWDGKKSNGQYIAETW
ncbi:MAG: hypothetical protein M1822_007015 [Bathelium mastoideum]|nr:MAG: hypothetical protein M1822_007015 [Bathelium mastoideum]